MSAKKTLEQTLTTIHELAQGVADPLGLLVVEVKFGQQGRRKSLEVTIFRKNGSVGLLDCETISRQLEAAIDKSNDGQYPLIEGAYVLEVQSPGIDRQLKSEHDFHVFCGQHVIVQAKEKVGELGISFTGTLEGYEDGKLKLSQVKAVATSPKQKDLASTAEIVIETKKLVNIKLHAPELQTHPRPHKH